MTQENRELDMIRTLVIKDSGEMIIEEFRSFADLRSAVIKDKNNKIKPIAYQYAGKNYLILKPLYHRANMKVNKTLEAVIGKTYPPRGNAVVVALYEDTNWYISMPKKEAFNLMENFHLKRNMKQQKHWTRY